MVLKGAFHFLSDPKITLTLSQKLSLTPDPKNLLFVFYCRLFCLIPFPWFWRFHDPISLIFRCLGGEHLSVGNTCPRTTTIPKFVVFKFFRYFLVLKVKSTFCLWNFPKIPRFFPCLKKQLPSLTDQFEQCFSHNSVFPTQQGKAYNFGFEVY